MLMIIFKLENDVATEGAIIYNKEIENNKEIYKNQKKNLLKKKEKKHKKKGRSHK